MKWVMTFLTVVLIVVHQDYWNWATTKPELFGFLPVGIWYHGLFCVAAAVLMWMWGAFLWPEHLEGVQPEPGVVPQEDLGH